MKKENPVLLMKGCLVKGCRVVISTDLKNSFAKKTSEKYLFIFFTLQPFTRQPRMGIYKWPSNFFC